MNHPLPVRITGLLILMLLLYPSTGLHAQDRDTTAVVDRLTGQVVRQESDGKQPLLDHVSGSFSLTNNGISLIPSFSLGDPAGIFLGKFARKRFSVEPDIRFSLEGRPWTLLFWFRYQAVESGRFSLRVGAHPALNFRTATVLDDGVEKTINSARRFLAAELAPDYQISEKVRLGAYYLTSWGFDDTSKRINFVTLNSTISDLGLLGRLYMILSPQVFYLAQDELHGFYSTLTTTLALRDFPVSVSALFNKAIDTKILPEDDFIWSLSLVYSF